ncbi:DUF2750 domain-containing protein [Thalassospira lucentensis]|uniref:DUF2750 domain-containing protein n=1 Tax=Thalassospira lucentensis TaxID=168935 RepID=UPI0009DBC160|nr:DUF2750 domain-containing protein [Thalassospira lucentensis]
MATVTNITATTDPNNRYADFLSAVATFEGVWGLYRNGWLLCPGDDGQKFCPFFPSRDDAAHWEDAAKTGYVPTAITLVELMESLLPDLAKNDIVAGISPTPDAGPIVPGHDQLHHDLITAFKAAIAGK